MSRQVYALLFALSVVAYVNGVVDDIDVMHWGGAFALGLTASGMVGR